MITWRDVIDGYKIASAGSDIASIAMVVSRTTNYKFFTADGVIYFVMCDGNYFKTGLELK